MKMQPLTPTLSRRERGNLRSRSLLALTLAAVASLYLTGLGIGFCSDDFFLLNWGRYAASSWELLQPVPNWYYRPLVLLLSRWEAQLLGQPAPLAHALSLAFHLLACGLVWSRLRRLGTGAWPAAFAVCWFGFHPLSVETVAWTAGRADLLSALGVLAAAELLGRKRDGWSLPGLAAAALAIALLAKESAAIAPLLIGADLMARSRRPRSKEFLSLLPAAVLVAVYLIAVRPGSPTEIHGLVAAAAHLAICFVAIFLPWPSNPLDLLAAHPGSLALRGIFLAAGLVLAGLLLLGWRRGDPRIRTGIAWGLIALIPAALYQGLQARYIYLPAAGAVSLAAVAAERLARSSKRLAPVLAVGVLALAGSTIEIQLLAWRQAGKLCREIPRRTRILYPNGLPGDPSRFRRTRIVGAPDHLAALYPYAPAYVFREGAMEALLWEYRDLYPPAPWLRTLPYAAAQGQAARPQWRFEPRRGALVWSGP